MKLFKNTKRRTASIIAGAIVAVAAVGWGVATHTPLLNSKAYAATSCIHKVDGINVNNANANVTVQLDAGCGTHQLVMKSYYAPSASGVPHQDQVQFDVGNVQTVSHASGPVKFGAKTPNGDATCFYQFDVVELGPNNNNTILWSKTNGTGTHDCTPPRYTCDDFTATAGAVDPNTGYQNYTFHADSTVKNDTSVVSYTINYDDGTVQTIKTNNTSITFPPRTYAPGAYNPSVAVTVQNYGGTKYTINDPNCVAHFVVQPVSKLTCDSLVPAPGAVDANGNQAYGFTANATAQNTTVIGYDFSFGDGSADTTVNTNATSASTNHTYAPGEYDAQVTVLGTNNGTATSNACKVHVSVSKPVAKLSCDQLTATPGAVDASGNQAYSFTANATAQNTTITSYVFDFGDGNNQTVNTSATNANANHTYAPGDFTASVTVQSSEGQKATSASCSKPIHVAPPASSSLVCGSLTATPGEVASDGSQSFSFSATASTNNATITNYVFSFGDSSADATVTTGALTANTIHSYAPGTYHATVTVNGTDAQGNPISAPANANCDFTVTVAPPQPKNPNISLTKVVDGVKFEQVGVGQHFVYQLVIKNTGDKDLTNAVVTDPAPAGVTMLSADLGTVTGNSFIYTIPTLAVGQSVTVNITAVVTTYVAGNLVNTACVDTPDVPGTPDSCDIATVTVTPPPVTPPVTPPTPPQVLGVTTLVNTGAGSVIGIAAAISVIAMVAHRLYLGRKLSD